MEVKYGKVIKATERELYIHWLKNYSDKVAFDKYKEDVVKDGGKIIVIAELLEKPVVMNEIMGYKGFVDEDGFEYIYKDDIINLIEELDVWEEEIEVV